MPSVAGLSHRVIIPVPVLTPWLSSHWVNVVTPVPKAIAQPLIESLRNNVVAREHDIEALIPFELCPFDEAVRLALARIRAADVVTRWSGASWPGAPSDPMPTDPEWSGGTVYRDARVAAGRTADTGSGLGRGRGHRRRPGLVLVPAGVGRARAARPARRRRRSAARAARSGPPRGRRRRGLLARRGHRVRAAAAAPGRDEAARRGVAGVGDHRRRRGAGAAPACAVHPPRAAGRPLLVVGHCRSTAWCSRR